MIVLERLFILSFHFFLVASGDNNTTSFYQGINTTVLSSTINVSPITSIQVQYDAGSASTVQPPASGLLSADDSIVTRGPKDKLDYSSVLPIFTNISPTSSTEVQNNASSSTTGPPTAKGLSNVDGSIVKLDYSSYEENSAFFSKNLAQRLRAWNNTLENASKQCIKELIKRNVTVESVEIKFSVFQTKDIDLEAEFLTLETVHPVLVREKSGHDLVNVAYLSILELWPLLVLCFTCAALSGMILWFLVSRNQTIMQKKNEKRIIKLSIDAAVF